MEMFHISTALRNNNVDSAILWAQNNSSQLAAFGSSFEFKLHQYKYLHFVKNLEISNALAYARLHFYKFTDKHMKGNLLTNKTYRDPKTNVLYFIR